MSQVVLVDYDPDLFDITPTTRAAMEARLAQVGATLNIARCESEEAVLAMAADADLVTIQSGWPVLNAQVIPQLRRCRGIIRMGIGYDSVDVAAATQAGIPVSNVVDWCSDEVAEHAIALLFASVRRLTPVRRALDEDGWARRAAVPVRRMWGKTLGLVGLGRIARAVASRMACFGLNLVAYDPYLDTDTMTALGVEQTELDDLLRRADFITVHTPLTEETRHLLGPREFGLMKQGVFVVNTSRGPVIDEVALIEALRSGKVAGAGLDVMEEEPLPADSPLRELDNVTLTPHIASYSLEAVETLYQLGADIAANLVSGHWVSTVVNPEVLPVAEARWGPYQDVVKESL